MKHLIIPLLLAGTFIAFSTIEASAVSGCPVAKPDVQQGDRCGCK